jgi:hypothetical protein
MIFLSSGPVPDAEADAGFDFLSPPLQKSSCLLHLEETGHTKEFITLEIRSFQELAEEALALRAVTIKVGQALQKKAQAGLPLYGQDLDLLSRGLTNHLDLRKRLLAVAESHECWLYLNEKELSAAGITPESQLEGIMLSLAAALVMYDNYLLAATLFEGDPKLRQLLNEGDRGYQLDKAELIKVSISYNSAIKRARVRRAMRFYEEFLAEGKHRNLNQYLATLIDQSPSYDMVRKWSPLHVVARKFGTLENLTVDSFATLEHEGISLFSMLFGNTVGLVETRKGKLYERKEVSAELQSTLKAGDILLEKTPFRLTDKLIPGYWGHAAIWIGTEQELRELGIWDQPLVRKYHNAIQGGSSVVEALRSGVEMNRLSDFLNIDSIGVLRGAGLSSEDRKQIVLQALRQVGKSYDFNFDVESLEKVYCSKLIYLAYHGVDWPVKQSFGRTTFTPDDVAVNVFAKDALELVSFYHDGRRIEEAPVAVMARIMGIAE